MQFKNCSKVQGSKFKVELLNARSAIELLNFEFAIASPEPPKVFFRFLSKDTHIIIIQ